MAKRIATKMEKSTLASLRRWNPEAPEEVLAAEARHRLEARMLDASESGERQEAMAKRTGYSLSQVERILRSARRTRAAGKPSPLAAWIGERNDAVVAGWEAKKTSIGFKVLVDDALAAPNLAIHTADEDWTRSVHRSDTGIDIHARSPGPRGQGTLLRMRLPEAAARLLGGRMLAALDLGPTSPTTKVWEEPKAEPVVHIVDGMLNIEGASGSSGFGFGDDGVRLSELIRLLSAHA